MKSEALVIPLVIATFLFIVAIAVFKLWLVGSVLTSSVKSISGNCTKSYAIERFVSGHWFCPEK